MTSTEKGCFQEQTQYATRNFNMLEHVHTNYVTCHQGPEISINEYFQRLAWNARERFVDGLRCGRSNQDGCQHVHFAPEAGKKWDELKVALDNTVLKGNQSGVGDEDDVKLQAEDKREIKRLSDLSKEAWELYLSEVRGTLCKDQVFSA